VDPLLEVELWFSEESISFPHGIEDEFPEAMPELLPPSMIPAKSQLK
jgi:hypothetical protein